MTTPALAGMFYGMDIADCHLSMAQNFAPGSKNMVLQDGGAKITALVPWVAPDFSFILEDGTKTSLYKFRGQPVVINLWATWCMPCLLELPTIVSLAKNLHQSGIKVLPIAESCGDNLDIQKFLQRQSINLPVMADPAGASVTALKPPGIPTTFMIAANGDVMGQSFGANDWSTLDAALAIQNLLLTD